MFNETELKTAFDEHAKVLNFPAESVIMEPGQYIKFIPIIIEGCIRVIRQNNNGDEIFLYHLMPGETCALSLTCCSSQRPSEVKTIAEDDTKLWAIPLQQLDEWQRFKEWRDFIALTYQTRFNKLLRTIDEIAFENMDTRLWKYLVARAKAQDNFILFISHEEISQELNIQRESATRLIKKLKAQGLIQTGRNQITILKKEALM
jgi:CRP/FNR family transcriptional regulator, anaerobic regulatory protein